MLLTNYHPGPPPKRPKWPGRDAHWTRKAWYRWRRFTYQRRWNRWYFVKYLKKSGAWRDKREAILIRDGYACVRCGSQKRLQVHHLTYERVGYERLEDLITLCKGCHDRHHGYVSEVGYG